MENKIDYEIPHYCPAYNKEIDADLCYESLMCLSGAFKISSVPELLEIRNIETAKEKCKNCSYSKL